MMIVPVMNHIVMMVIDVRNWSALVEMLHRLHSPRVPARVVPMLYGRMDHDMGRKPARIRPAEVMAAVGSTVMMAIIMTLLITAVLTPVAVVLAILVPTVRLAERCCADESQADGKKGKKKRIPSHTSSELSGMIRQCCRLRQSQHASGKRLLGYFLLLFTGLAGHLHKRYKSVIR
jgi:hypothetical protein